MENGMRAATRDEYACAMGLIREDGSVWQMPCDPVISVQCRNVITRRYVAKSQMRGSIKERWSQDDYEIDISGALTADSPEELADMVATLREILERKEAVPVVCDFLQDHYDVTRMAVESFSFPFTKGATNQQFTIKAYSDDGYTLLEEL